MDPSVFFLFLVRTDTKCSCATSTSELASHNTPRPAPTSDSGLGFGVRDRVMSGEAGSGQDRDRDGRFCCFSWTWPPWMAAACLRHIEDGRRRGEGLLRSVRRGEGSHCCIIYHTFFLSNCSCTEYALVPGGRDETPFVGCCNTACTCCDVWSYGARSVFCSV